MAERAVDAVLAEARAAVAAGREPDEHALRARLGGDREALARLARVLAVGRARGLVTRPVPAPAAPPPEPSRLLRTRPAINANMDVRRDGESRLVWDAVPAVAGWEVRISERPDPRSDYAVRGTHELRADETRIELRPTGDCCAAPSSRA